MASVVKLRSAFSLCRASSMIRPSTSLIRKCSSESSDGSVVTHTGQKFEVEDYRNARFIGFEKKVNPNWAIDLVAEDPIVVVEKRGIFSDGGGALGHPRVFINLDPPEVQTCGYSGRRFIQKKYYKEAEHGPCISYEEYLQQMNPQQKDWPN